MEARFMSRTSSSGVIRLDQSCVPLGSHPRMYSAATMAIRYDRIDRLIVEISIAPLSRVNAANDLQNN
eukprot:Gb_20768 [translate_table: standard]